MSVLVPKRVASSLPVGILILLDLVEAPLISLCVNTFLILLFRAALLSNRIPVI